jgi:molecular chaperone DnaJ
MYGQPQKFEGICPHCQGSGKIVTKQCPVCHGKKILDKVKTIEVEIPAKFQGKEIKLRNYGPEQQLGAPSDFLVQIEEIPSEHWRRNGDNLFYTM